MNVRFIIDTVQCQDIVASFNMNHPGALTKHK